MSLLSSTFSNTSTLLRSKAFRSLWTAQAGSLVATNMLQFALVLRTYTITGSTLFVGLLIAVISLPSICISSFGGLMADRNNRRAILVVTSIIRAALTTVLFFASNDPPAILVVIFLLTILTDIFNPTVSASLPLLVERSKLMNANALFAFTYYSSFLFGYTAAGPLLHWGGMNLTLVVAFCLFAGCAAASSRLPVLTSHLTLSRVALRTQHALRDQWMAGIRFIRSHHWLGLLTLEIALLFGIERGVIALVPLLASSASISVAATSLFFITPLAGGTIMGVLLVNRLKSKLSPVVLIHAGMFIEAGALLLFAPAVPVFEYLAPALPSMVIRQSLAVAAAMIAGVGNVFVFVSAHTYLQREAKDEYRGRVFGSFIMAVNAIGLPIILILSHFGAEFSPVITLGILGLVIACSALISLILITTHLRVRPHPPDAVT